MLERLWHIILCCMLKAQYKGPQVIAALAQGRLWIHWHASCELCYSICGHCFVVLWWFEFLYLYLYGYLSHMPLYPESRSQALIWLFRHINLPFFLAVTPCNPRRPASRVGLKSPNTEGGYLVPGSKYLEIPS